MTTIHQARAHPLVAQAEVSLSSLAVIGLFLKPTCQCVSRNPIESGDTAHAWALSIGCKDMFFFRFCVTILRIENAGFLAIFAKILLVAVAVLAIFLQVTTATTATLVDFLFNDHAYSLHQNI